MKILIVEDDENILSFLQRGLIEDGYSVESTTDGKDGEYLITQNIYDVIILDWMLPNKNGIEVLKNVRSKNVKTPILMLTAKGDISDKVLGLNEGSDDYLTKPFSYVELKARIESLYRRSIGESTNIINVKDIQINIDTKMIIKNNYNINLNAKEYELFLFLIKYQNVVVSNYMIEEQLWNIEEYVNSNVIQVTIYNLRKKIGKDIIKNFRGLGYKIEI